MGDSQVVFGDDSSFDRWPAMSARQGSAQPNASDAHIAERKASERRSARRAQNMRPPNPDDRTRIDLPALSSFDEAPQSPRAELPATPSETPARELQAPPVDRIPAPAQLSHAPWTVAASWGASSLNTPNTLAGFSYLFWWVSGLLVYFNERHNRFVRFHAVQSILLTGVLTVTSVVLYILWELSGDLSAATHQPAFAHLGQGVALIGYLLIAGLWLGTMIAAWSGHHLRLPIVGAYADRYAAPPREPFPPSPFSD